MTWSSLSFSHLPNLGDRMARPDLYFDLPIEHFGEWKWHRRIPPGSDFIGGGGGVPYVNLVDLVRERPDSRIILWGTGWVYRRMDLLPAISGITLWGSRDVGQAGADAFVPCVSCMSPYFDREYEIQRDVGAFWNPDHRFPGIELPYLFNTADPDQIFHWLGSSETIVTNSYHGAYWGVLLRRKVIVVNPISGKFLHFQAAMQPPVVPAASWREAKPTICANALDWCREQNIKFYDRVLEIVNSPKEKSRG